MPIFKSTNQIGSLYLGTKQIARAFRGTELIYESVKPSVLNVYVFDTYNTYDNTIVLQNDRRGDTSAVIATDWGDGTVNTELSHTYAARGIYTVKTKYSINTLDRSSYDSDTRSSLVKVSAINSLQTDFTNMFYGCNLLQELDEGEKGDWLFTNATSTANMFYNCSSLTITSKAIASNWDLSNVTDTSGMFSYSFYY